MNKQESTLMALFLKDLEGELTLDAEAGTATALINGEQVTIEIDVGAYQDFWRRYSRPSESEMKKIKFTQSMDSFVWEDLKEYGPFEVGQETEIFSQVADLIIEKGSAEEVKNG